MKWLSVILLLLLSHTANAEQLTVFLLDGYKSVSWLKMQGLLEGLNKGKQEFYVVQSNDGSVLYSGKEFEKLEESLSLAYNEEALDKNSNNVAYALDVVMQKLTASAATSIQIIMVDSVFYQDEAFDFNKGYPSDGFLTQPDSKFSYIDNVPSGRSVSIYIYNAGSYYLDQNHQQGLMRFYVHLFKKLGAEVKAFNSSFNQVAFSNTFSAISENTKLSIINEPLTKKIYASDSINYTIKEDILTLILKNEDRANMAILADANGSKTRMFCDEKGVCTLNHRLTYGDNAISIMGLQGKEWSENIHSTYLPKDEFSKKHVEIKGKSFLEINASKSYRADNAIVTVHNTTTGNSFSGTVLQGKYKVLVDMATGSNLIEFRQPDGSTERFTIEVNDQSSNRGVLPTQPIQHGQNLILLNGFNEYVATKDEYEIPFGTVRIIKSIEIEEYDGDFDASSENVFDVFVIDEHNILQHVASNLETSGDNVSKIHSIVLPKPMTGRSLLIRPKTDLGGSWKITNISVGL